MPTVFITGANRGLGLELARQYRAEGWHVIGTCRDPVRAGALRALDADVHPLDVTDLAAVRALGEKFADATIDLFLANAGVYEAREMTPDAVDAATWLHGFTVNAIAPLACAGAFVKSVARSGERKMVAMSTLTGSIGANEEGGKYVYRSTKAALNAVWRSFAIDHPEIIAVVVSPGWVRTEMGGPEATLDVESSISGVRRVISGLRQRDSGGFFRYDGSLVPW